MAVFEDIIFTQGIEKIINVFGAIPEFIAAPVINIILIGMVFSITYQGLEVIRGAGGANPILDVIAKSIRPMFVLIFAATFNGYSDNILPFFKIDLPELFITAANKAGGITSTNTGDDASRAVFQNLDTNIDAQMNKLKEIVNEAKNRIFKPSLTFGHTFTIFGADVNITPIIDVDVSGIPVLLVTGLIFIVIIIGAILVCLQACFIVVAWNFVLSFGPIFVAMYAFEKTEKYAQHWLEGVLKYTFALIVLMILYSLFGNQLTLAIETLKAQYLKNPRDVAAYMTSALAPVVISIVAAYIVTKSDQLAQDLVGGGLSASGGFATSTGGAMAGAAVGVGMKLAGAVAGAVGGSESDSKEPSKNKKVDAAEKGDEARKNSPASAMLAASSRNNASRDGDGDG